MIKSSKGVFFLVVASFVYALVSVSNRYIPGSFGPFFQLFIKAAISTSIFFLISLVLKSEKQINPKDWPTLILRGVLMAVDLAVFYLAITHLPVGTTLFLFYAGSISASYLYGYFFLKEKLTYVKIISIFLALTGLYIIYANNLNLKSTFVIFALLSGACFGLQTSISKKVSARYSINQINLIAFFVATLLSIPLLLINHEKIIFTLSPTTLSVFLMFAVLTNIAIYTTIYGFKYVEAQKASLILLGEIIFAILIGFIFFKRL